MGAKLEKATFTGGCFWCMEPPFKNLEGVLSVVSGYTGGSVANPTYEDVCSGKSGHLEVIQITFNPTIISYPQLLDIFWRNIDPTDQGGQFADRGTQYKTAIFVHNDQQRKQAEISKSALDNSNKFDSPIYTPILEANTFFPAEEYHQTYFKKNAVHYKRYRTGSGRESFLEKTWKGSPSPARSNDLEAAKRGLSPEQYNVTQNNGTERPFQNAYWDHHQEGVYVDIVSSEPLFASIHKFDSGTGWPSFYQALEEDNVIERLDTSHGTIRTEVRSKQGNSHLGHLFPDGPGPTGKRFCINSASLKFIPESELKSNGLERFLPLFSGK